MYLGKTEYHLNFEKSKLDSSSHLFDDFNSAILNIFPACRQVITTYRGQNIHELVNPNPRVDERMPIVNAFYSVMIPFIPHLKDTMLNNRDTAWNGRSVAKCVLSALTGISLKKGVIKSLDTTLGESLHNAPEDKQTITLRQLLTMTSGMPFTDKIPEMPRWLRSKNWVNYLLSLPLVCKPGEKFSYSTGNSHLLAAVLNQALDGQLRQFAQIELFNPLGIGEVYWEIDPQGIPFGGANLFLSIHEMLKIGYLYLQNGSWNGQQLLPQQWVIESMTAKVHAKDHFDYGYAWWIRNFDIHDSPAQIRVVCACGWAGQRIYIIPQLESVIAIISKGDLWANTEKLDKTFGEKLLPALKEYIQCAN